jgi:hypothetical protein
VTDPLNSSPTLSPTAKKILDHAAAERKREPHHSPTQQAAHHETEQVSVGQPATAPRAGHRKSPSVGDMISRTIFGGFWGLVAVGLAWTGLSLVFTGDMSGLITVGVSVLPGLYSRYIFRGGRFRILFW